MNYDEWKWWKEKIHDYKNLDSLSKEDKDRLVFCCLEFIINSLQPERSKREDSIVSAIKNETHAKLMSRHLDAYEMRCSELYGNIET